MCVILQRRYVERGLVSFSSFVGLEMFVAPCVVGMMVWNHRQLVIIMLLF